jgi:hypothetical protein
MLFSISLLQAEWCWAASMQGWATAVVVLPRFSNSSLRDLNARTFVG